MYRHEFIELLIIIYYCFKVTLKLLFVKEIDYLYKIKIE